MNVDLQRLLHGIRRPDRFASHDAPFWDDPHISRGMLDAHLDLTTDAATRHPATVAATVAHLYQALELRDGARLLDLGCGPGIYATAFAHRGVAVTGIDLSQRSIAYALELAAHADLTIDYRVGDYTTDPLAGPYDAAVLIYLDLGVLDDPSLERLLDGVRAALRPGGMFAFDVCSAARPRVPDGGVSVEHRSAGFWRATQHLVIESTYRYGRDVDLTQVAIVETDGQVTTYRIWERRFTLKRLERLLARHGFAREATWGDLTGATWTARAPIIAVAARRLPDRDTRLG